MINRTKLTPSWVIVAFIVFVSAANARCESITNSVFGFCLTIPDGFISWPEQVEGDVIYAFQRELDHDEGQVFIFVKDMGGQLPQENPDPSHIKEFANGTKFTLGTEKWKGFNINVFRLSAQRGNIPYVQFNAQVPLTPMAMQVSVTGPTPYENETKAILRTLLDSVDGETNWLTTEQTTNISNKRVLDFTIAFVLIVGGYVLLQRWSKSKRTNLTLR